MNRELRGIWQHMVRLATGAVAHANRHSCYFDPSTPWWLEQAVLQAAHAAELMLKARIAQMHPLLIFEQLPKHQPGEALLDIKDLFERGRTYQWADLPARLWATTGQRLQHEELYYSFGKLRNMIQHFAVPEDRNLSAETIDFVYKVLDPFMFECWGLCAIDYDEDDSPYQYLTVAVIQRGLLFNVSAEAAANAEVWEANLEDYKPAKEAEMRRRMKEALERREIEVEVDADMLDPIGYGQRTVWQRAQQRPRSATKTRSRKRDADQKTKRKRS